MTHPEQQYLDLLRQVLTTGQSRTDRTGTGTVSQFGVRMEFDVSETFPLFTTKKVSWHNILHELLWFVRGQTDSKILEDQKVRIWRGNTSSKFLTERGLNYREGDCGPIYGFQWRHWNAEYEGCDQSYQGFGTDQLFNMVEQIKNNPYSRRHILSAWNVEQLDEMSLPPCHVMAQFYVTVNGKLDCQLYQRSGDLFLGVPYNVASYSCLIYMLAHMTGYKPGRLIHVIGDAHIYNNHVKQVNQLLQREPKNWPILKIEGDIKCWDDFQFEMFKLKGYESWPAIRAPMAV